MSDVPKPNLQSSREAHPPKLTTQGLSVIATAMVFGLAIWRADKKDIPLIVKTIVDSGSFTLAGWILAVAFLLCGAFLVKVMRDIHRSEIERLAKERDSLQSKLMGGEAK